MLELLIFFAVVAIVGIVFLIVIPKVISPKSNNKVDEE